MQSNTRARCHRRILAMPSAIGASHVKRLLLIAHELSKYGAEVAFGSGNATGLIKRSGFEAHPLPDVTITDFTSNVFAAYSPLLVEQCVREEVRLIEAFQPDVVVGDFRPTAAISSRLAGVPYVSVVNGYVTDYFDPVDVLIPEAQSVLRHKIASVIGCGIQAVQKRSLAAPFRQVARHHRLKGLDSLYDFLAGDLTLIADLPEFCPLPQLPASYHYVGPLVWEGAGETTPVYLETRDRSRPLLYATIGNTGQESLLQRVVEAYRDDKTFDVVATTGQYVDPSRIPSAKNIHVERFIPGSLVLQQCVAAIHCGGNGTTYQVIANGVPAVVVPFNNDQTINAWLIKRRRLGIPLQAASITRDSIRSAVEAIISDEAFLESARHFQGLLGGWNGAELAANRISSLLAA